MDESVQHENKLSIKWRERKNLSVLPKLPLLCYFLDEERKQKWQFQIVGQNAKPSQVVVFLGPRRQNVTNMTPQNTSSIQQLQPCMQLEQITPRTKHAKGSKRKLSS